MTSVSSSSFHPTPARRLTSAAVNRLLSKHGASAIKPLPQTFDVFPSSDLQEIVVASDRDRMIVLFAPFKSLTQLRRALGDKYLGLKLIDSVGVDPSLAKAALRATWRPREQGQPSARCTVDFWQGSARAAAALSRMRDAIVGEPITIDFSKSVIEEAA